MKVISIGQPFAQLVVLGIKTLETRVWTPPIKLYGERIGIASTKNISPKARAHFADETFQSYYRQFGLPERLEDMANGFLLGTVIIDSADPVLDLDEISHEEQQYGWFEVEDGKQVYMWRLREPRALPHPIPIRGAQGIYDWKGELPDGEANDTLKAAFGTTGPVGEARPQDIRRHLRVV